MGPISMESWIQRTFTTHVPGGGSTMEEVQQHWVLLVTSVASLLMSLGLVFPLVFMQRDLVPRYLVFTLYLGSLSMAILALVRTHRLRAARWTAVAGFWSLATFAIATSGGIYSSVFMLYVVLIILAGLTFGLRGGLHMTLLNVGATFAFLMLGRIDLLPAGRPTPDTIQVISILYQVSAVLALIGVTVMVFRQTVDKMRQEGEERQRTERELHEEQTLTVGLFNSLPGLAILVDAEGRLVRWNREVERAGG